MCTAVLSIEPGAPVLLGGVRDEFTGRAWQPPGWHWPDYPGLIGGRDLQAGGTWLAVAPATGRVACVLNGRGRMAPARSRRSRGILPLQAASGSRLTTASVAGFDPFHLLSVGPAGAVLYSWDGTALIEQALPPGLHVLVNGGLASAGPGAVSLVPDGARPQAALPISDDDPTLPRVNHFLARLQAAPRPAPRPGVPVAQAWAGWLPLMNGDSLSPDDPRALIVRRDLGAGRTWGTTSISLVALPWASSPAPPGGLRYDFTGTPGDPAAWYPVTI